MAWIFAMKVVLVLSCVMFMVLAMRVSVPLALEFMASHVPLVWSSALAWLRPPYLYVVVNGIIISIAASCKFHHQEKLSATTSVSEDQVHHLHHHHHHLGYGEDDDQEVEVISPELDHSMVVYDQPREEEFGAIADHDQVKTVVSVNHRSVEAEAEDDHDDDDDDDDLDQDHELVMEGKSTRMESSPPERIIPESEEEKKVLLWSEKPLVSAGLGDRKPVKPSPEGVKVLKVASKPKRHETMENTWKAIMESHSMSFSRSMKRWDHSDLENHSRQIIDLGDLDQLDQHHARSPMMKKSETFMDRTNQQPPTVSSALSPASATGKLQKESSLSQDELNRRVEAFINKFNEQMRLQRQESLNHYLEMINRGSH